jgi:hypothetical protein
MYITDVHSSSSSEYVILHVIAFVSLYIDINCSVLVISTGVCVDVVLHPANKTNPKDKAETNHNFFIFTKYYKIKKFFTSVISKINTIARENLIKP